MIRHVMRMVWNRKRSTGLIMTELLISFLVLCTVLSVGAYYLDNYRQPLGFNYEDVWMVGASFPVKNRDDMEERGALLAQSREVLNAMRSHSEVLVAAPAANVPYSGSTNNWGAHTFDGSMVRMFWCEVGPEAKDVYELQIEDGRWLQDGDESLEFRPLVVTRSVATAFFGDENPIGKDLPRLEANGEPEDGDGPKTIGRIVGIVGDYRKFGELAQTRPAAFTARNLYDPEKGRPAYEYTIRVAPGTTAAFEEPFLASLQQVAPAWSFELEPISEMRDRNLRTRMMPLIIGGTIAAFLILMVGMGLVGVLWQNVTQRTQELGLRRALGATANSVRMQILGELLALTSLAVGLGALMFLQLPFLQLLDYVPGRIFLGGTVAALFLIYPFVLICGLYPSWLATRVQPAQALQYE